MEVLYRLSRRERPAPTDAFLMLSKNQHALIRYAFDPSTRIFPLRSGFLILPADPGTFAIPGAIRLRRLAGDFYIPADADLSPALLPEELISLTQAAGLVFLPGGAKWSFDPRTPLPIERLFQPLPLRAETWTSLPQLPDRPNELKSLRGPEPEPAAILETGKPANHQPLPTGGDGEQPGAIPEDARPPSAPLGARIKAGIRLGSAHVFNWLGRFLEIPFLTRLAANQARKAIEQVPRLGEKVLGEQEAALREVLRQLREGDIEKGLRRAPIAVADPDAAPTVDSGSRLGDRDPRFSFRDLVVGSGSATVWLGGGDVWIELAKEYRRLADEAIKRGDVRRAAYLHGVLLRDIHTAAAILRGGGMIHEAAILYRDRLKNLPMAASLFAQAGDHEEALRIYLKLDDLVNAARTYRILGYEAEAMATFQRAADRMAEQGKWHAAGKLMRWEANHVPQALRIYRAGWLARHSESVACGIELQDEALHAGDIKGFQELLVEAEFLLPAERIESGTFFNHALGLAEFLPQEMVPQLKDRVRLHFARELEAQSSSPARGRSRAQLLFGSGTNWSGSVHRDATYAAIRNASAAKSEGSEWRPFRVLSGTVRHVVVARGSFDVIIASDTQIVCWRVGQGIVSEVAPIQEPVFGLAVDAEGKTILQVFRRYGIMGEEELQAEFLRSHTLNDQGTYTVRESRPLRWVKEDEGSCLAPAPFVFDGINHWAIQNQSGSALLVKGSELQFDDESIFRPRNFSGRLFLIAARLHCEVFLQWMATDAEIRITRQHGAGLVARFPVTFAVPPNSSLNMVPFDWLCDGHLQIEIVGIDGEGVVHWLRFEAKGMIAIETRQASLSSDAGYLAACLLQPGSIAAVDQMNHFHWLRISAGQFREFAAPVHFEVPTQVVYLFHRPQAREVMAILEDGTAIRVALP